MHDELTGDPDRPLEVGIAAAPAPGMTVEQAASTYCTTAAVRPLSQQLIEEIECLRPGTMARIDDLPGVALSSSTLPYLQRAAAEALARVGQGRALQLNSALRTTAQQYMLYSWYQNGRCADVVSLAAPPGRSNHESGLAVDVDNWSEAKSAMQARGFAWLGASDVVHYDYVGSGGLDLRSYSVQAFQRLWNRNHPDDRIAEDGAYGAGTAARMRVAPAAGFAAGASCGAPTMTTAPIEVYWARTTSGSYDLRALAPAAVVRVDYQVDGFTIGEARRSDGANFPTSYTFSSEGTARRFAVIGYDAQGRVIARGVGLLDVTAGVGVYIRQLGAGLYEIGLERAPAAVAAIEVRADTFLLRDAVSGATRSTRGAVRSNFTTLGPRTFRIATFNAEGTERGTLTRSFTLE